MKKVLITGGAGYLGSVLTEVLLNKGYQVTVLDNLIYKQTSVAPFSHNKNFTFILGDVTIESTLKPLVELHDVIIPLAAIVGMPACKANPEMTLKVNYELIDSKSFVPSENSNNKHVFVKKASIMEEGKTDLVHRIYWCAAGRI